MDTLIRVAAQLGLDQSFYYLLGVMFVLYLFLSNLYLKPFQKILLARKSKTEGVSKDANELNAKADDAMLRYRDRLRQVNQEIGKLRTAAYDLAKKDEALILAEASKKSKDTIQEALNQLENERKSVNASISGELKVLAGQIATKVMGRSLGQG